MGVLVAPHFTPRTLESRAMNVESRAQAFGDGDGDGGLEIPEDGCLIKEDVTMIIAHSHQNPSYQRESIVFPRSGVFAFEVSIVLQPLKYNLLQAPLPQNVLRTSEV